MKLTVLASGSKGNGYILHNDREALLIEAGVPFDRVLQTLRTAGTIAGCIVTHEHSDHAGHVGEYLAHAVPTYMTEGTAKALAEQKLRIMKPYRLDRMGNGYDYAAFRVGRFRVKPFATVHDAAEPVGFLIDHPETGRILFATDTATLPYRFDGLAQVMLECNWCNALMTERQCPESLKERVRGSHMPLTECICTLAANGGWRATNIVLLHVSESDGDGEAFRREVQRNTAHPVHLAAPGLTIDFNQCPI